MESVGRDVTGLDKLMAPRTGVEPVASPLGGVRSIQLSYRGADSIERRDYRALKRGESAPPSKALKT